LELTLKIADRSRVFNGIVGSGRNAEQAQCPAFGHSLAK
jgi:hypothetical protein